MCCKQEGLWDSQRCQRQGTCTSAPTSGSIMKSSVLEDSAKESYSPAELEHMEKVYPRPQAVDCLKFAVKICRKRAMVPWNVLSCLQP